MTFTEKRAYFFELLEGNLKANAAKDEIMELAGEVVKKGTAGTRGPKKDSKVGIFRQLILDSETQSVTEDQVWATLRWGKHEAQSAAWAFRKKASSPEDILWVQFETSEDGIGSYVLKGQGADCPEDFVVRERKAKSVEVADVDEATDPLED